jgi:tetratricopeptide (TPR) repeat protein
MLENKIDRYPSNIRTDGIQMNDAEVIHKRHLGYFLMVALTCLVYANSFDAGWHFDDWANIIYNQKLHVEGWSFSSLIDTFYASPADNGQIYRPVACLSFALNWYFHQQELFGYHLINITIHCLAALLLVHVIVLLYKTPILADRHASPGAPYWIALLAATLWALHPIQTQAVTYIVQRMASLAGLFYLIGLLCFMKGRLSASRKRTILWFFGALSAYLLALGSKENAIIFPLALVLIEVAFFSPVLTSTRRRRLLLASAITGLVLASVIGLMLLSEGAVTTLFEGYGVRYFNHVERLLTQFRLLSYYLFQIICPSPAHLSIEHEVVLSTGLLSPWTTLPACLFIFGGLWASLFWLPKFPLSCFGFLFYLLHHSVESSIFPLELLFEHRNYIPSMFLFIMVAEGVYRLLSFYQYRNRVIHWLMVSSCALVLFSVGLGTYSRNSDWHTEKTLWEDALSKAPESSRALHNIAWGYYEPMGDTEKALELYERALKSRAHRKQAVGTTVQNIANIYYNRKDYHRAVKYFRESLNHNPQNIKTHLRLVHSYVGLSEWEQAETVINRILDKGQRFTEIYRLKGFIHLNKNDPREALKWFRRAGAFEWQALAGIGQCLRLLGFFEKGDFYLRCAQALEPNKLFLSLNRMDLYLAAGQRLKAEELAERFVKSLSVEEVAAYLETQVDDASFYPLDYERIIPLIKAALDKTLSDFEERETLANWLQ